MAAESIKQAEKRGRRLLKRLQKVDNKLDKIIAEIATTKETSNVYWTKINIQIRKQYEEARKIAASWTNTNIPAQYKTELNRSLQKIKSKKIPGIRKVDFKKFANSNIAKQSLQSLIAETNATFATGFLSGQKTMIQLSRLTQQINISEKQIEKNIAEGFLQESTLRGAKKRLHAELLKKSLDGKYITVINKNGEPTQWKINTYSELVARTKLNETTTQAVINSAAAVGGDLVQVSSHNTQTPYDAQFEEKIFSLSGSDPIFPSATDLPPFHPNCLHTITVTFRQTMKRDGTLKRFEQFSNNEIDRPPNKKTFVPIKDRKIT